MNTIKSLLFFFVFLTITATAQVDYRQYLIEDPTEQSEIDQNRIVDYLVINGIDMEKTESGIFYELTGSSTGVFVQTGDKVVCSIKSYLLDATVIEDNSGKPKTIDLETSIMAWQELIPMIGVGQKCTFISPSHLAHGDKKMNAIPANAVIVYEIEVIEIIVKKEKVVLSPQMKKDDQLIQDYLKENKIEAKKTESGLYYLITKKGDGAKHPDINSVVETHYEGKLLNGDIFDSSYDREESIEFPLASVIKGWQEGIPLISKGGKALLFIPSHLAYGEREIPNLIPSNSVLIFTVELLSFD